MLQQGKAVFPLSEIESSGVSYSLTVPDTVYEYWLPLSWTPYLRKHPCFRGKEQELSEQALLEMNSYCATHLFHHCLHLYERTEETLSEVEHEHFGKGNYRKYLYEKTAF